ncbi:LPS-assembly protein LptD [Natronospirillum operosum]|uniref:LPS-assembly protein LptD n=1 Tax=Natronospirillum operosum TaxID=2759953 RepID=A0A4Z0WGS9_9GAMM|nr:LPS-assembly protein LptD [Natronospirillum operosum]TGG94956.1 LPS-assembly protein LptD [Natronospirillum operosum]
MAATIDGGSEAALKQQGKRKGNPQRWQKPLQLLGMGLSLSVLLGMPSALRADTQTQPTGGYLDWVFYDDLPAFERNRISQQCPGSFIDPWTDTELPADEISIEGERQRGQLGQQVRLDGEVRITQAVLRLYSDTATYDLESGQIGLPEGGLIRQPDLAIQTAQATAETETDRFSLYDARYVLHMANLHGAAEQITREDNIYQLERAWMTRCAPNGFGWSVHARTLRVNTDTDIATGTHARLHVGPVPVAYTPYLRLNLNQQRSSGFLGPSATYYSGYNQLRISTPFYWDIAPNFDNTTTVDWMIGGDPEDNAPQHAHIWQEWRYLNRFLEGELLYGVYPDWDRSERTDAPEWGYDLSLASRDTALEWTLDYRDAGDDRYFPEYLGENYETNVINRLTLGYEAPTQTRLDLNLEQQNVFGEPADQNRVRDDLEYVEQPGLHIRQPWSLPADWQLQGLADWERRYKEQPDYLNLQATEKDPLEAYRLRNRLVLSRTDNWQNWTLNQRYTADHTWYTLPDFQTDTLDEHPREGYNRLLWDTRHRLSYRWDWTERQTLTPFAQYEYRPLDERQVELPLMNSSVDRLRDRNRITLGSRYRFTESNWRYTTDLEQWFNLSKELLGDSQIRTDDWTNPQAGNITWRHTFEAGRAHEFGALFVWKPDRSDDLSFYGEDYAFDRIRLEYTYAPGRGGLFISSDWNLDNDGEDDPVHEIQTAAVVPVTGTLGAYGYLNWQREEEADALDLSETIVGFEYDGCCWHVQLAGQRFVNDDPNRSSGSVWFDTIQLNLTLKGLGSVGGRNSIIRRMSERIPDFSNQLFDTR